MFMPIKARHPFRRSQTFYSAQNGWENVKTQQNQASDQTLDVATDLSCVLPKVFSNLTTPYGWMTELVLHGLQGASTAHL